MRERRIQNEKAWFAVWGLTRVIGKEEGLVFWVTKFANLLCMQKEKEAKGRREGRQVRFWVLCFVRAPTLPRRVVSISKEGAAHLRLASASSLRRTFLSSPALLSVDAILSSSFFLFTLPSPSYSSLYSLLFLLPSYNAIKLNA